MKKQQAAKSKARGILSDSGTPNSSSRQNSPKVASPNPTSLLASIKKEKERAESELAKRSDKNGDHDEKQNQAYDRLSGKKRSRDHSEESDKSRHTGSSGSHSSPRSPRSESLGIKKRRHSPGSRKSKKGHSFGRDKNKKKYNRSRSRSRSLSPRSPLRSSKTSKKSRREESKDYYKDNGRDYSDKDFKDRDYYKERDYKERRSYSPEKDRHRSRKNRSNGHRDSPIREKVDKHRS